MTPLDSLSLPELLALTPPPEPSDFADFWRQTYAEALSVDLSIDSRPIPCPHPAISLHEIEFNSLDGVRIGGWLTVPVSDAPITRGVVVGHGYGGRAEPPDGNLPGPPAVAIYPCARGFHRSSHDHIPGNSGRHVLHGITRRETYSHRGSAADLWCAASALLRLFPSVAPRLDYSGGSFGGGIGALAIPWDSRFRRAWLDVPSFGNHPLRLQIPCTGSGESVRLYHLEHPEIFEVLRYFDSANAASHFTIPVFVSAALRDPTVPPAGQFSVYNAIKSPRELFVRTAGHPSTDEDNSRLFSLLDAWFSQDS